MSSTQIVPTILRMHTIVAGTRNAPEDMLRSASKTRFRFGYWSLEVWRANFELHSILRIALRRLRQLR